MFEKLKKYLTKEYMRLSEEKENLLSQKICLETEYQKKRDFFYDDKEIEKRKRIFYPFEDVYFELVRKEKLENNESVAQFQILDNKIHEIENSIDEMKDYIQFIQSISKKKNEKFGVSDNLRETIDTVVEFMEAQYSEIEFLTDFEEENLTTSVEFNSNLIRILIYTISSTIETVDMDSVIIDVKKLKEKINITLYMLLEDEVLDYYTYDFHFIAQKTEDKINNKNEG